MKGKVPKITFPSLQLYHAKLHEFIYMLQKDYDVDPQEVVRTLYHMACISNPMFEGCHIDTKEVPTEIYIHFRSSEPFINLDLQVEKFVYSTFLSILFESNTYGKFIQFVL